MARPLFESLGSWRYAAMRLRIDCELVSEMVAPFERVAPVEMVVPMVVPSWMVAQYEIGFLCEMVAPIVMVVPCERVAPCFLCLQSQSHLLPYVFAVSASLTVWGVARYQFSLLLSVLPRAEAVT